MILDPKLESSDAGFSEEEAVTSLVTSLTPAPSRLHRGQDFSFIQSIYF